MYLNIIKAANFMALVMVASLGVWLALAMEYEQKRLDLAQQESSVKW